MSLSISHVKSEAPCRSLLGLRIHMDLRRAVFILPP